ncbi:MAG TPA: hypothetical protein VH253_12705 [Phycisphaerae bacterium]|nr:hypothetical protein [Phycisphaerae bacterium]
MAADEPRRKKEDDEEPKEELITGFEVGIRVFLARYGSYLLLAAAFALLGWQLWNYFQKKHQIAVQEAWLDLESAEQTTDNFPAKIQDVITEHNIRPVQAQAWLMLGDYYLQTVSEGVAPSAPGAKYDRDQQLASAEDAFRKAVDGFPDERVVAGGARMGLGIVAEDRGNWTDARKQYEALSDPHGPFAGTAFATMAADRLSKLDQYKDAPRLATGAAPDFSNAFSPGPAGSATQPGGASLPLTGPDSSFMLPPGAAGAEPAGPPSPAPQAGGLSVEPPTSAPAAPAPPPPATMPR